MADQLYLSYKLSGFTEKNMVRHFEKLLQAFPFSKLSRQPWVLRINAVSFIEPPLYEEVYEPDAGIEPVLKAIKEFQAADCAANLEAHWDIWQHNTDWSLAPSRVALSVFGPGFESQEGDNLRIDLGIDTHYLPQPELPHSLPMAQSNIRSLLTLVHDLDGKLSAERRRLWTESGENFADKVLDLLGGSTPGPRLVR